MICYTQTTPILFVDAPRLLGASWGFVTGDINKVIIVTTDSTIPFKVVISVLAKSSEPPSRASGFQGLASLLALLFRNRGVTVLIVSLTGGVSWICGTKSSKRV